MTGSAGTARAPDRKSGALVRFEGVAKRYGTVTAVESLSLDICENEFFALLGPSGCGKTTLLRSIAGFEQPDSGAILLGGDDLLDLPPNKRPVNLMFQSYALFPHMSVERNIAYGLEREKLPRAEVRRRTAEVLETVGLTALAKRRPGELNYASSGNASAWRSRARSSSGRACCCSTSRWPRSTRSCAPKPSSN